MIGQDVFLLPQKQPCLLPMVAELKKSFKAKKINVFKLVDLEADLCG